MIKHTPGLNPIQNLILNFGKTIKPIPSFSPRDRIFPMKASLQSLMNLLKQLYETDSDICNTMSVVYDAPDFSGYTISYTFYIGFTHRHL